MACVKELEARWLDEKAQWQKVVLSRDEEIRNLRTLAEKLKGADVELSKALFEKKALEARVGELAAERSSALSRVQSASDSERRPSLCAPSLPSRERRSPWSRRSSSANSSHCA